MLTKALQRRMKLDAVTGRLFYLQHSMPVAYNQHSFEASSHSGILQQSNPILPPLCLIPYEFGPMACNNTSSSYTRTLVKHLTCQKIHLIPRKGLIQNGERRADLVRQCPSPTQRSTPSHRVLNILRFSNIRTIKKRWNVLR